MNTITSSISSNLLRWLMIPIIALLVIDGAIVYSIAIDIANDAYDDSLTETAESLVSRLHAEQEQAVIDLPKAARAILKYHREDQFFFQVFDGNRQFLYGDRDLPALPKSLSGDEPVIYTGKVGSQAVRCVVLTPSVNGNKFIVQVGETLRARQEMTIRIMLSVVCPQILLVLLAAAAVWYGIKKGLQPLSVLQEAVGQRTPTDLSPIGNINAPSEVVPLLSSINHLLERMRKDRESQKRFVANAAHQLRTPLAGLNTQAQLLLQQPISDELQESIKQICLSAEKSTRLVRQLLALARVEPTTLDLSRLTGAQLDKLTREAIDAVLPIALEKSLDLGLECHLSADAAIMGEIEGLHQLVTNLIENAVIYAGPGGKVTIRIENDQTHVAFIVEDDGPGIPPEERERVFERFYRVLGTGVRGSGLGLAIVREIADLHGASIEISSGLNGRGTTMQVNFPALPQVQVIPEASQVAGKIRTS